MTRALRAEWTKLRTLPSTGWALVALVAGTLLFTALVCATSTTTGGPPPPGVSGDQNDVVSDSLLRRLRRARSRSSRSACWRSDPSTPPA